MPHRGPAAAGPLPLAGLEAPLGLVDHINAAPPPHQLVIAVAAAQGFQGIADFHDTLALVLEYRVPAVRAPAGACDSGAERSEAAAFRQCGPPGPAPLRGTPAW